MFPELTNSYKVVLVMQMLACYILVVVVGLVMESWLWFAVAFALDTLKDCFVVTALIGVSRANAIGEETQRKLAARQGQFGVIEGRLLNREELDRPAPTLEIPGAPLDDNWNN